MSAAYGRPVNPLGLHEPKPLGITLLGDITGIRVTQVDLTQQHRMRIWETVQEVKSIQAEMRRIAESKFLTEDDKRRLLAEQGQRVQDGGSKDC
jgi:hypothetical protein